MPVTISPVQSASPMAQMSADFDTNMSSIEQTQLSTGISQSQSSFEVYFSPLPVLKYQESTPFTGSQSDASQELENARNNSAHHLLDISKTKLLHKNTKSCKQASNVDTPSIVQRLGEPNVASTSTILSKRLQIDSTPNKKLKTHNESIPVSKTGVSSRKQYYLNKYSASDSLNLFLKSKVIVCGFDANGNMIRKLR